MYDFNDRVTGSGYNLKLLKLANEIQSKRTSVIGRMNEGFKVSLQLPSDYTSHEITFEDPFVCIQVGNINNDHILFHYCMDLIEAKDVKLIKSMIKELKLILKDIQLLKKDKIPYELEETERRCLILNERSI